MKKNLLVILILVFFLTACSAVTTTPLAPTETPHLLEATSTEIPTLSPTATQTETPTPSIESLSITQQSVNEFANAMQNAGVNVTKEQLLQQGIQIQTVTGVDGKQYEIATTHLDPDPNQKGETLEGDYPLMVKVNGEEWEKWSLTYLLKSQGIDFGFTFQSSINPYRFNHNNLPPKNLLIENSIMVSPEDSFFARAMFYEPNKHSWEWSDEYVNFLKENNLKSGAPVIVSGDVNEWMDTLEKETANERKRVMFSELLASQMKLVVSKYKDTIHAWTINEIFNSQGGMNRTIWQRTIGTDYPEIAITAIREDDPNAIIVINDFQFDSNPKKNQALYSYVADLKHKGILRDGDVIGLQAHVGIEYNKTTSDIKEVLRKYIELGFRVEITELDVFNVPNQDVDILAKKANVYDRFISSALELNNEYSRNVVVGIIVWGLTNASSWIYSLPPDKRGDVVGYPLLFNTDGTPEITYYILAKRILNFVLAK